MELIEFKGKSYPLLQSCGFASQYAFAFAEKFCQGVGVDVGYSKLEWAFPMAQWGIDDKRFFTPNGEEIAECSAIKFPKGWGVFDNLYSSHCLEHIPDYVAALDYWNTRLIKGGVMFLYLPNMDYQQYWQCENNRKHVSYMSPKIMQSYFANREDMWKNIIVTDGYDLNGSFYCVCEKI